MLEEYKISPNLDAKEAKENEFILNKLKIAYDILINDERRRKYDSDLAKKRAEDLIKNVSIKTENKVDKEVPVSSDNTHNTVKTDQELKNEKYDIEFDDGDEDYYEEDEEEVLSKEEQDKLRKAAQDEFKKNLKKAQEAEKEYNQAYEKAYNDYMKKIGGQSSSFFQKLKKIRNTFIIIVVIVLICLIAWLIPPVRNWLQEMYNTNIIFKMLADIVISIINAILGMFKK